VKALCFAALDGAREAGGVDGLNDGVGVATVHHVDKAASQIVIDVS